MYCSLLQRNLLISTYPTEVFCTCGPQLYSFFTPCKFFSTKYGHVSYLLIISSLLLAITSQLAMTASSLQLDLAVSVLYSIQVLLNQLWLCQLFTPCQFYSTNYYFFSSSLHSSSLQLAMAVPVLYSIPVLCPPTLFSTLSLRAGSLSRTPLMSLFLTIWILSTPGTL